LAVKSNLIIKLRESHRRFARPDKAAVKVTQRPQTQLSFTITNGIIPAAAELQRF